MYLRGIETKFNRDERNDDGSRLRQIAEQMSIFSQKVRPFGAKHFIQYLQQDINTAHWQLQQESNLNLIERHQKDFAKWFAQLDVIQLNYMFYYRAVLIKCNWFDTNVKKKRIQKDYIYTCIDVSHKWYKSDPYIIAIQEHQVFYVNDHKFGSSWKVVQKFQHRHILDVPEIEEEVEEQEEIVETTILEVEEEDLEDHQFHKEDVEAQTLGPNVVFSNQNDDIDDIDDVNEE
ncbi:hypothetical protein Ddye_004776 [Dipteronia dyeriana]|uniref:DUF4216 domain-containing protein n=1 Tax=Dipteronia dyeriana TaxID=168575 RepID=A0AAE0CPL7_9ROSI|nr:hypothetical protein Ddye_004776 [Dipteronia dyeriana]